MHCTFFHVQNSVVIVDLFGISMKLSLFIKMHWIFFVVDRTKIRLRIPKKKKNIHWTKTFTFQRIFFAHWIWTINTNKIDFIFDFWTFHSLGCVVDGRCLLGDIIISFSWYVFFLWLHTKNLHFKIHPVGRSYKIQWFIWFDEEMYLN